MVGLEPTTFRLTADRSTIELHAIMYCRLNHHTGLSSPYLYLLITRQRSWTRYRTSNGDSTPRAKLKSEYLTHGRFFIGRGLPVLCWWISPASAALPTLEQMGIEPKPLRCSAVTATSTTVPYVLLFHNGRYGIRTRLLPCQGLRLIRPGLLPTELSAFVLLTQSVYQISFCPVFFACFFCSCCFSLLHIASASAG